jgi:hypothetical protein
MENPILLEKEDVLASGLGYNPDAYCAREEAARCVKGGSYSQVGG